MPGFAWISKVLGILFGSSSLFCLCSKYFNIGVSGFLNDFLSYYRKLYVPLLEWLNDVADWMIPDWNHDFIALIVFLCALSAKMRSVEAGGLSGTLAFMTGAAQYKTEYDSRDLVGNFLAWLIPFVVFVTLSVFIPYIRVPASYLIIIFAAIILIQPVFGLTSQEATIKNKFIIQYYWGSIAGVIVLFAINSGL